MFGILAQSFQGPMSDLKSAPAKQVSGKTLLKDQKVGTFLALNMGIWARNLKKKSQQKIPCFRNLEILAHFGSFCNFFGSFRFLVKTRSRHHKKTTKDKTEQIKLKIKIFFSTFTTDNMMDYLVSFTFGRAGK